MGNSEVGHLNIGAGRIVFQDITRIDSAIQDRSFFQNNVLNSIIYKVKKSRRALHLIGLVSDGGVHSSLNHLHALLEMINKHGLDDVFVHAILDGRDTPDQRKKLHQEFKQLYAFKKIRRDCNDLRTILLNGS